MTETMCSHCGWRPRVAKDRCRTCYEYRRRHGHDRPSDLVVANVQRRIDGYRR